MSLHGPDRPEARKADLIRTADALRDLAQQYDAQAAALIEQGFRQWHRDTVYPVAVNRWIHAIGGRA